METENKHILQRPMMLVICALICTALWGSAFPCIKTGYRLFEIGASDSASQLLFAGIRFFIAGFMAILFGSVGQKKLLIPKKSSIKYILMVSLFQTIIQYVLFYIGLAHTTGVKGSIIQGTGVLFSLLIACLIFKTERFTTLKVIGCIVGFVGVVLVNLNGEGLGFDFTFIGEGFMIMAAFASSFSASLIKMYSKYEDPVTISGYQFAFGGFVLICVGAGLGGHLSNPGISGVLLLAYMAFISAAAYSLWGLLLKYNPVTKVTVFGFTNQIFGVIFSMIILSEASSFGIITLIALAFVSAGIIMVNRR